MKIFCDEDLEKWKLAKQKVFIAPITFFVVSTGLIILGKKFQINKLIANPLLKEDVLEKSKNRWSFLLKHTVVFGTLGVCAGAYFKKEFNKYLIFKEYEKEVNFYMRWKIENEIVSFINERNSI